MFGSDWSSGLGIEGGNAVRCADGLSVQRHSAAQLDASFVDQSSQSERNSLFGSTELSLMGSDPGHFPTCDDTARHCFKEEFTECHDTDSAELTLGAPLNRCMTCSNFFMPVPPAFPSDLPFSIRHQV